MADNENKLTIYQQLNKFLNLDGFGFQQTNPTILSANNNLPPQESKIIIKGNSPEEIHRKGLELEQKRELQNKFFRTTDRGHQKALQYEAGRLALYMDVESMEYYPIIASALDLFMEEATTIGQNGKMLNVYSNKERIKNLLEEFFYDIYNVNVNLPFDVRNVVKYGDNFKLIYGERKKGITHVKQLVNYEIERFERIQNGKPTVRFKERMTGDEFNTFEIAHFRLLGDDKLLPYGSSQLGKIRRCFRQLVMAEDAMLTYRIIRAGEKKVFKIDVGNIDEDDVEAYIYKVATKFKRSSQVSPHDGQIDHRFNILGNDEDYFLPQRNANSQTGIDTLPGASNLNDINDISYMRDNLLIGLGIPKPFLSMQDAAGGGKNMAQYDIRFAKKITRIQQAIIQELNKMAVVHLILLGYSGDDLKDFTLTLNNPSTQQELLKSQLLREKAQTYKELTGSEGGIAAMSHTMAKRTLFNMSDKEIVDDLKQQKMEKSVMQELVDSPTIIKKTGLFTDIDKRYGEPLEGSPLPGVSGGTEQGGGGQAGAAPPELGGMGGTPGEQGAQPTGGNAIPPPIPGMPNQTPSDLPPVESVMKKNVLSEENFNKQVEKLVYGSSLNSFKKDEMVHKELIKENDDKNIMMNVTAQNMINEIDLLLKESESINTKQTIVEEVEIDDIEDIDI